MKSIIREHIERRTRAFFYEDATWRCTGCNTEGQYAQACDACSDGFRQPWCPKCNKKLDDDLIDYASTKRKGTTVVELVLDGYSCKTCKATFLRKYDVEDIDLAADEARESYRILRELGIQTKTRLEIFVGCNASLPREPIRLSSQKVAVQFGDQSRSFASALEIVTRLDTSDYGHSLSKTLRVSPPPPYGISQRRALQLLLARLRLKLGSPLYFWSQGIAIVDEDEVDSPSLSQKVISWPLDPNREALALLNEIVCDDGPGAFMNSFRLLELILHRTIIDEVKRKRYDRGVSDDEFIKILRIIDADLKTRMRHRIESISPFPDQQLRRLWSIVRPATPYDRKGIYEAVASFRNQHAHRPNDDKSGEIVLPWEGPNMPEFTSALLDLIAQIM